MEKMKGCNEYIPFFRIALSTVRAMPWNIIRTLFGGGRKPCSVCTLKSTENESTNTPISTNPWMVSNVSRPSENQTHVVLLLPIQCHDE